MKSKFSNLYYMAKKQAMQYVVIPAQVDRLLYQSENAYL